MSLHRYAYVYQRPIDYNDQYGYAIPLVPIAIVGGLALIDYGLDAYDLHQANEILNDPNSTAEEREYARQLAGILVDIRQGESLTGYGLFLPIDDLCRWGWKGIKWVVGDTVVERFFGLIGREGVQSVIKNEAIDEFIAKAGRLSGWRSPYKGDLTQGGHALAKHGGRPGSVFPNPKGNPSQISQQADDIINDILNDPNNIVIEHTTGRYGDVVDITSDIYEGAGLRFSADGTFIGFLEP